MRIASAGIAPEARRPHETSGVDRHECRMNAARTLLRGPSLSASGEGRIFTPGPGARAPRR
jgi:hypothetical protein